jgi:DnaJ-class molecular chaperone
MTTYFSALGLPETATPADVKKAYAAMASNGDHPDKGGDPKRWALITAAFNELKRMAAKKRGRAFGTASDLAWLRDWNNLNKPAASEAPKQEAPKDDRPKYVFVKREGESKEDARRRYARESQQFKYQSDPDFAQRRRDASKRCNDKKRAAKAAAAASA